MKGEANRQGPVSYVHRDEAAFPLWLEERLGHRAPPSVTLWGERDIWLARRGPVLGLFCASRAPGAVILAVHELAQRWRRAGPTVISGFHSPVERYALEVLLHGSQPVIVCPERGLEGMRLKAAYREPMAEGRLLLLSPFGARARRLTARRAAERNRFVAALADVVLIAHAHPGSRTAALAEEAVGWGKLVYTVDHPSNEHLLARGARAFDRESSALGDMLSLTSR